MMMMIHSVSLFVRNRTLCGVLFAFRHDGGAPLDGRTERVLAVFFVVGALLLLLATATGQVLATEPSITHTTTTYIDDPIFIY